MKPRKKGRSCSLAPIGFTFLCSLHFKTPVWLRSLAFFVYVWHNRKVKMALIAQPRSPCADTVAKTTNEILVFNTFKTKENFNLPGFKPSTKYLLFHGN
jgi:hypothetical protein